MAILKAYLVLLLGLQGAFAYQLKWNISSCGVTDEIPGEVRTKVPWVAAVFVQISALTPYTFFVTGTILGPSAILTVLGGAYGQSTAGGRKYSVPAPEQHRVAVGLRSTDLSDYDEHTQIVEVSNTIPYPNHEPENKLYHLVIFQLKTPLNLSTPYARAACVPSSSAFTNDDEYYTDVWTSFVLAGGFVGSNNDQRARYKDLKGPSMLLDNRTVCEGEFAKRYGPNEGHDIYCGRLALGLRQQPTCPSYGTAAVGFNYGQWYMLGVLALYETGSSWCGPGTVFFFSKLVKSWQWIMDFAGTSGGHLPCGDGVAIRLDQICDQKRDCKDARDESPIYCRGRRPCTSRKRGFECGVYGPCLNNQVACNGRKNCPNGEDEDPKICPSAQERFRKITAQALQCPPLEDAEGLKLICTDKSKERLSCGAALPVGAAAHYSCQEFYHSSRIGASELVQTCLESGVWDPPGNFKCTPECGKIDSSASVPFIVGGEVSSKAYRFPWHASIFRMEEDRHRYICGGSLIEKNILVTAAHCVVNSPETLSTANLHVLLGVNNSNIDHEDILWAQQFKVTKAWIPPSYDPLTLVSDIALLQLNDDAVFDQNVRPVCYLSSGLERNVPLPGTLGKVPGFGLTEDGEVSEYLRFVSYPVASTFDCLSSLAHPPPVSTFCAGYKNGTSVCQGDSGGGLVFPELINGAERYVLKGLVSRGDSVTGQTCNPFNYGIFTHVDAYADWILNAVRSSRA